MYYYKSVQVCMCMSINYMQIQFVALLEQNLVDILEMIIKKQGHR
jgi:hypothetical protein